MTKSKLVVVPSVPMKILNANRTCRDSQITLSPLLTCIESEQALHNAGGSLKFRLMLPFYVSYLLSKFLHSTVVQFCGLLRRNNFIARRVVWKLLGINQSYSVVISLNTQAFRHRLLMPPALTFVVNY